MKKFLLTCSALAFVLCSWAQERAVSGKVSATEDGSALPGVNVVVKGTTNGTVTDSDGNFSLNVSGANQTLVFSFIGLQTQEVAVGEFPRQFQCREHLGAFLGQVRRVVLVVLVLLIFPLLALAERGR